MNSNLKYFFSGILVVLILFSIYNPFHKVEIEIQDRIVYVEVDREQFSEQNLIDYLLEVRIPHPHIVFAQARLETGHFTSTIFLENNNLFGMKRAYSRPSTAIGMNRGHAKYESWQDSVIDFALYKAYVAQGKTEKEYFDLLKRSYAEDPRYISKVKQIIAMSEENFIF